VSSTAVLQHLVLTVVVAQAACLPYSSPPSDPEIPVTAPEPGVPAWPAPLTAVTPLPLTLPKGFRRPKVVIDAGHGAYANTGPRSVFCELEEDFDLRIANDLGARLLTSKAFRVRLSRNGLARPSYQARAKTAAAWGAQALLSIHSDVRGPATLYDLQYGGPCYRQDAETGFAVLYADNADAPLNEQRQRLAVALALRLSEAGFAPYSGYDYQGIYEADPAAPGVFIDRHPRGQRIYMLNHTTLPAVVIETHQALSLPEASRWREEATLNAFAAAVAQGLVDAHTPEP